MILRRITHSLSGQNWPAIGIEFVLVVAGVFLGIMAANWNEDRLEERETRTLLQQVGVTLSNFQNYLDSMPGYYESVAGYSDRAVAGWAGDPDVTDEEFVIAAYQASQIISVGNNAVVFGAIFGAENLRDIKDPVVRQNLANVMTYDYELIDLRAVSTRYREEVRKTIPHEIQAAIRERCGDRFTPNSVSIPAHCDLHFPPREVARAATALRSRPELVGELYWHRAAVANQLANVATLKGNVGELTRRIGPRQ